MLNNFSEKSAGQLNLEIFICDYPIDIAYFFEYNFSLNKFD